MKILVALDYTSNQDILVEKGVEFAKSMNASLTLLHVFYGINLLGSTMDAQLGYIPTNTVSNDDFNAWCEAARKSEAILQTIVDQVQTHGVTAESLHLWGQAGPVICSTAEQMKANIIMIGRRAAHPSNVDVEYRALGSVSHFVAHYAPCSVWIIQEDPH